MKKRIIFIALLFLFAARSVLCDSYGFFVDGGYSPGSKDTDLDKMVDKRVDDAKKNMEDKDPKAKTKRIDKKDDLLKALEDVDCKCGDEITLYMVGHGNKGEFCFTKEDKKLKAEDLRKALTKAAKECCCKIHVVIFACHSGSFIEELFKEEHVMSVYTSCTADEVTHSDAYNEDSVFFDGGDWAEGFNKDYKKSTKKDEGDRIQEASETAKQEMPDKFYPTDHPQGWRRGEFPAKGHVVERKKDNGKDGGITRLKIHFYEPEFLRCTTKWVIVRDVAVPDSVDKCKWVTLTIETNTPAEKDTIKGKSDVVVVDPVVEKVLAHVEERYKGNRIKIHIIHPKWLYCRVRTITVEGKIDDNVQPCRWINIGLKIRDPDTTNKDKGFSTGDDVKAHDQEFKCKVHVEKFSWQTGKMEIHILEPAWLNCQRHEIVVPEGERDKLRQQKVDKCSNVVINITFHSDGTVTGKGVKVITDAEGVKKFSLDATIQKPKPPVINDSTRTYQPFIGVTNTGLNTISFPVYAVICKLSEKYLIDNWWRTGEGEPSGVWHDMKNVSGLPFAETRIVNFSIWTAPQGTETYWLGFRTKLQDDENPASDTVSIVFTVAQQTENHPPVLLNAHVAPDSGTVNTSFAYSVTYRDEDNDAPSVYQVLIDNSPHNMTLTGNNYNEGVVFTYQTTLGIGGHNYSFRFDDGHGHPVNTQTYSGPMVVQTITNHAPILLTPHVMPDSGTVNTSFAYSVTYRDEDNDAPAIHQVLIDNSPFNMTGSGNYTEGVVFSYQTTLGIGTHTYSFRFDDGHGHTVNTQTYSGPIVTQTIINHAPVLQQGSAAPDSGNYYTPFVYRVLYIDQDNDAPTVYQAYIDNVPFNMNPTGNNYIEGVFFVLQRNLNQGNHTFYFRFDDGHGHMVTSQTYTGPMVH